MPQRSCPKAPNFCSWALQGVRFRAALSEEEVDRIVALSSSDTSDRIGFCERQALGVPWTESDFAQQMLKFSHPSTLQMGTLERMSYRASKLGYWLKVLVYLKDEERSRKQGMNADVEAVLRSKNICLWEAMLKARLADVYKAYVDDFQLLLQCWAKTFSLADDFHGQCLGSGLRKGFRVILNPDDLMRFRDSQRKKFIAANRTEATNCRGGVRNKFSSIHSMDDTCTNPEQ